MPTYVKHCIAVLVLLMSSQFFAQNLVPFAPRYDEAIKGDILLIGNSTGTVMLVYTQQIRTMETILTIG